MHEGLYEWLVMPFGLSNVPSIFMLVMNQALQPFIGKFISSTLMTSLSTVLVLSYTYNIPEVLRVLRNDKFYAMVKKCVFMAPEVLFLAYVVSSNGLRVDEPKIEAIRNWPRPKTITEVRRFYRLAAFYRRFIPHFSSIMAPVTDYMKGSRF